jgi:hypothetical protein
MVLPHQKVVCVHMHGRKVMALTCVCLKRVLLFDHYMSEQCGKVLASRVSFMYCVISLIIDIHECL